MGVNDPDRITHTHPQKLERTPVVDHPSKHGGQGSARRVAVFISNQTFSIWVNYPAQEINALSVSE
jgi:hypothetical protein